MDGMSCKLKIEIILKILLLQLYEKEQI